MNDRIIKRPPSGGVRYSKTAELTERIRAHSLCVVKVQENGNNAIARETYDKIKKSLFQIELSLNRAVQLPSEKAYFYLNEVQALIKEVSEQVYEILLGLHPNLLNQFGLLPVLLWYFESYNTKTNILVNFKHHGLTRKFTPEISSAAFYIVKEALDHISRSATGDEVTVQIWVETEVLNIRIENYHMSAVPAMASITWANNMKNIEAQVRVLGGKMVIDSSSGPATRLIVELPLLKHARNISLS